MQYPTPLKAGSVIAITAFSAGISTQHEARYQDVKAGLQSKGFKIIEGECLRGNHKHVSAPLLQRAEELMAFLLDDAISAIAAPWGGELAMEILPYLDFDVLSRAKPKWLFGFSDISTMTSVLSCRLGWATAHSANLMDFSPKETNPLIHHGLDFLSLRKGEALVQSSSESYTHNWPQIEEDPYAVLKPHLPTHWQWLVPPKQGTCIEGRLLGGCWDTLMHLFDTPYLDLKAYSQNFDEGILLYLENVEMTPADLTRTILSMKFKGVFTHIDGLLLGRSAFVEPDDEHALTYHEVLSRHLTDLGIPVLIDMDIGHVPPNLTLINGALAKVECENGQGKVTQFLV